MRPYDKNASGWMRVGMCVLAALSVAGCGALAARASAGVARDLTRGILEQNDPDTVADGLPAYLLLMDGLISGRPEDAILLVAGSKLYSSYAGSFVADPPRRIRLALKADGYARRATCISTRDLCDALDGPYDEFEAVVSGLGAKSVDVAYALATAWAGLIQADPGDMDRIAALPRVQLLLEKVVALAPGTDGGAAWMYLGVMGSLRPESLGGRPAVGKAAFESAIERSGGRNLMAKTLYAEYYARLVFDQELHDRLLHEVLDASPDAPGLTLGNVLAQRRAQELLESGKDYF
jgi:hypothetical protein